MTSTGYWWLALLLGLVVALVAVALLHLLLRQVWRVERAAGEVWQAGKQVAANTANTWVLAEAAHQLDLLAAEAGEHRALYDDGGRAGGAP
jgi:hypothetical protein